MSKKGLIASLIVALVATLSLGIYTLVSVFGGQPAGPVNTTVNIAFRMGDDVQVLKGYSQEAGTLKFVLAEGKENPLTLNAETGDYKAEKVGEVEAVVTLDGKGNTNTYKIKVYYHGQDAGLTEDKPLVLASKAHVVELRDALANTNTFVCPKYLEFVNHIDLSGENWKPIGSYKTPYRLGVESTEEIYVKGNGFEIRNMNIHVTKENYTEFLSETVSGTTRKYMYLGFFGSMNTVKVSELNFVDANIKVDAEVYTEIVEDSEIREVSIGILSANARKVDVVGGAENKSYVSGTIDGFSYYINNNSYSGIGGVIGDSSFSSVENYKVDLTVKNTMAAKYSNIGGVFGNVVAENGAEVTEADVNKIAGCEVELEAEILYNNLTIVAGFVAESSNLTIVDSEVKSLKVSDPTANADIDLTVSEVSHASGAVGVMYQWEVVAEDAVKELFLNRIENVKVSGLDVSLRGGNAYGFAGIVGDPTDPANSTKIVNSSVNGGTLHGSTVAGFAGHVYASATIEYTAEFAGAAVQGVNLIGTRALGFADEAYANINSAAENKTKIETRITGLGSVYTNTTNVAEAKRETYVAGAFGTFGAYDALIPTFEGFEVVVSAKQSINYAGVAMYATDAIVNNVKVYANFLSSNAKVVDQTKNVSSTYIVAGVVGYAEENVTITAAEVVLDANQVEDKTTSYGAAFVGGLVGRMTADNVTLTGNTVSGNLYFNYSYYKVEVTPAGEEEAVAKATTFNAGGLVGAISAGDGLTIVDLANTTITGNTVDGLTIVADLKELNNENQLVNSTQMNELSFARVKSIGALVGTINNQNAFSLEGNTIGNVNIQARTSTFTINYTVNTSNYQVITLGNNKLSSYGWANTTITDTESDYSKVYNELA